VLDRNSAEEGGLRPHVFIRIGAPVLMPLGTAKSRIGRYAKQCGGFVMALSKTGICDFGWKARDFKLKGVDGKSYKLADVRGPKGTLVVFICNHCPYVKASIDRIVAEAQALRGIGIGSVAIMPNDTSTYREDSFDNMKAFAAKHSFTFPYVIDETQEVARAYDAQCTPDFFGFNAQDELQYRGRLDASRLQPRAPIRRDLFEAMNQIAKTGHGPEQQLPSMGCSIKWKD
jgi:peroxiredoxin